VRREVVRLVTPGTLTEESLLDARRHNFLAAFAEVRGEGALAWVDISTGAFHVMGMGRARLGAELIGQDLARLGITADCLPVLDLPQPGANPIIGDRALGEDVDAIAALGQAQFDGLRAAGVRGVIKHIPGHGRAMADSHLELPVVDTPRATLGGSDFVPFRRLGAAELAMTAHVVYSAIDPDHPATLSHRVIEEVIRGEIGFDGLLMTDDLSMKALSGDFGARARHALAAGCDLVLHCNGNRAEMEAIMRETPSLSGDAARRAEAAAPLGPVSAPAADDEDFENLLRGVWSVA